MQPDVIDAVGNAAVVPVGANMCFPSGLGTPRHQQRDHCFGADSVGLSSAGALLVEKRHRGGNCTFPILVSDGLVNLLHGVAAFAITNLIARRRAPQGQCFAGVIQTPRSQANHCAYSVNCVHRKPLARYEGRKRGNQFINLLNRDRGVSTCSGHRTLEKPCEFFGLFGSKVH